MKFSNADLHKQRGAAIVEYIVLLVAIVGVTGIAVRVSGNGAKRNLIIVAAATGGGTLSSIECDSASGCEPLQTAALEAETPLPPRP